jgi:hypothetical protein
MTESREPQSPEYVEFNDVERTRDREKSSELLNLTYTIEFSITAEAPSASPTTAYTGIYFNGEHLVGAPVSYPDGLSDYMQKHLGKLLIDAAHRCFYEALNLEDLSKGRASASAASKRVESYFNEELKEAKQRLGAPGPGGKEPHYDFFRLLDFYEQYYPEWKKATRSYKSSPGSRSTEERLAAVAAAFPKLPVALVARLNHPNLYWRTPSYIAAEQAGRLCGLPEDRDESSYSPRYLLARISKMKASR